MAEFKKKSGWSNKFRNAFKGIAYGVQGQNSFWVHIPVAIIVMVAGFWLQIGRTELMILAVCVSMVLVAELFNSSLEILARAITTDYSDDIRRALDCASGAVLLASIFAELIGLAILVPPIWQLLFPSS